MTLNTEHILTTVARAGSRLRRVGVLFGVATAVLAIAGCATKYPPAPVDAATADYNYHIGPLDTVNVIVWRNGELSMSVPVRPDGKITTPLIDDLPRVKKRRTLPSFEGKDANAPVSDLQ